MVYNSEIIKVNTFWAPEALAIDFFLPLPGSSYQCSTLGCCDTRLDLCARISVMICVCLKNACSARIWNHHYIATVNMSHSVEIGVRSSSCSRIRANPIWRPQKTHLYYDWVHQWTQDTVWNCEGLQVEKAFKCLEVRRSFYVGFLELKQKNEEKWSANLCAKQWQ